MVASFGYSKERDGSCVKKGAQPNDDEGQLPVEEDSSLFQSILDRFDGLQTYVGERFDALERQVDMRFDAMDSRITKVEEDVTIIRDCLNCIDSMVVCDFLFLVMLILYILMTHIEIYFINNNFFYRTF